VTAAAASDSPASVETCRAGWHLMTVHGPEAYPGLQVVKGGEAWLEWVILGKVGQTVVARGGEQMYGYETSRGVRAEGFVLRDGDRATIMRAGLEASLVEWRLERPGHPRARRRGH
jgi:hypothetical protein